MFRKFRPAAATMAVASLIALSACGSNETADEGGIAEAQAVATVPPPAGKEWSEVAAVTPEGGIVEGNPDAPIKLVEYASHTCGHCAEFSEQASDAIRSKYVNSGRVSYEIRNQIHDPIDLTFAVLARCAGPEAFHPLSEQGWANLEAMFTTIQANNAQFQAASQATGAARFDAIASAAGLYDFFAQRGISRDQARSCLAKTDTATKIAENSEKQSEELNVTGTPTFFINGKNVGTQSWASLEPMLQRAGAR
ncbi:DsbA family protein [Tsuneonella sp. YG55]|uniref:DsbA family protein n=1 Tax=Tsuneonella litorea TaxID=2976475 RepID=A0A9X2W1R2_9SPHN|nr:DsbA family protein [Tsuneonella litorea]MCT2558325.1 DsbA family protein [Tsuneonella litorea]